ncbi:MAG TPA: hypothetical protein VL793_14950 [Patescibacteria group bacterium]|nr:hypothetical protein [Patescibacteria group bacterium]
MFGSPGKYLCCMRLLVIVLAGLILALGQRAARGSGGVVKVLPEFLDLKGRNSLSPSLYERDVYQGTLRQNPERRSGIRFYIQWKTKKPAWEPLLARVELRGITEGRLPRQTVLEQALTNPGGSSSHWTELTLNGEAYKTFGSVTAWRVTLWEGQKLIGQQQSFLW